MVLVTKETGDINHNHWSDHLNDVLYFFLSFFLYYPVPWAPGDQKTLEMPWASKPVWRVKRTWRCFCAKHATIQIG